MGYFPVRYDTRVVNYDCRGFIRLATGVISLSEPRTSFLLHLHFLPIEALFAHLETTSRTLFH